jgi:hypothetical protein
VDIATKYATIICIKGDDAIIAYYENTEVDFGGSETMLLLESFTQTK